VQDGKNRKKKGWEGGGGAGSTNERGWERREGMRVKRREASQEGREGGSGWAKKRETEEKKRGKGVKRSGYQIKQKKGK